MRDDRVAHINIKKHAFAVNIDMLGVLKIAQKTRKALFQREVEIIHFFEHLVDLLVETFGKFEVFYQCRASSTYGVFVLVLDEGGFLDVDIVVSKCLADVEGEVEVVELDEFGVAVVPVFLEFGEIGLGAAIVGHVLALHDLVRFDLGQQQSRELEVLVQIRLTIDFPVLEIVLVVYSLPTHILTNIYRHTYK